MKTISTLLLAVLGAVFMGSRSAEATFGFGYRANEKVRIDHCYRSPAWDYAVPFYLYGPKRGRYAAKHRRLPHKHRHYAVKC